MVISQPVFSSDFWEIWDRLPYLVVSVWKMSGIPGVQGHVGRHRETRQTKGGVLVLQSRGPGQDFERGTTLISAESCLVGRWSSVAVVLLPPSLLG